MYRTTASGKFQNDIIVSLIANETDIFDYVIIQPSTYFIDRLEPGADEYPDIIPVDHSTIVRENIDKTQRKHMITFIQLKVLTIKVQIWDLKNLQTELL